MKDTTINVNVVDELKASYLDYSMAVIIGRAIPNLYDGLKPVTRPSVDSYEMAKPKTRRPLYESSSC